MRISFKKTEKEIIDQILGGDDKVMEELYLKYRNEFISWSIGKFGISRDDALDHYQDTLTIFFEKVMNGSLEQLDSSLKTYLFGIGKNKMKQKLEATEKAKRHEKSLNEHYHFLAKNEAASDVYERAKSQATMLMTSLGDSCREILKMFYFEKKNMSEIAKIMKHKSEAVSRTTKKRCLEKLRSNGGKPLSNG